MPKTKPAYSEEFKREVLAHMASTGQSRNQTATHFEVLANSCQRRGKSSQVGRGQKQPP
jgi:transposase-like protein